MRCYCNLPACITTGYMCKSAGRGCFSDLVDHVDVMRARHGCLDLLDSGRQRQCKNQPKLPPTPADQADDDQADDADAAFPWDGPHEHEDADDDDGALAAEASASSTASRTSDVDVAAASAQQETLPRADEDAAVDAAEAIGEEAAGETAGHPLLQRLRPRPPPVDVPSLLLCCVKDMCNHVDNPEARARHSGKHSGTTYRPR